MEHMSKYARKRAARIEAQGRAMGAIDFALKITSGEIKPNPKPKKPPQLPPQPRGLIGDLGDRPKRLAALLESAAASLREAEALAEEVYTLAKLGLQRSEPLAISQFIVATAPRVEAMAARAAKIRNVKQEINL